MTRRLRREEERVERLREERALEDGFRDPDAHDEALEARREYLEELYGADRDEGGGGR